MSHFFHRTFKAYNIGTRKRRKINTDDLVDVRWHKTGKTKPVIVDGRHLGCKKIMVLYMSTTKGEKPEKTNWVMHQYHLGTGEDEKDGEYVVSKIFYQQQSKPGDKNGQDLGDKNGQNLTMEIDHNVVTELDPTPGAVPGSPEQNSGDKQDHVERLEVISGQVPIVELVYLLFWSNIIFEKLSPKLKKRLNSVAIYFLLLCYPYGCL